MINLEPITARAVARLRSRDPGDTRVEEIVHTACLEVLQAITLAATGGDMDPATKSSQALNDDVMVEQARMYHAIGSFFDELTELAKMGKTAVAQELAARANAGVKRDQRGGAI
jgi:hypothetical protein